MTLGETILSRRKTLALTQEQVAERLGVTPQAVYKWEKDIACPDVQLLSPLARLLETDLNTLFAYDTEPDNVELSALIERVSRLALQKDGQEAAFAEARAALRKYPVTKGGQPYGQRKRIFTGFTVSGRGPGRSRLQYPGLPPGGDHRASAADGPPPVGGVRRGEPLSICTRGAYGTCRRRVYLHGRRAAGHLL